MTPGQAAYEAAVRVMLDGDTAAGRVPDDGPDFAWDAIGSLERASWKAAATAGARDLRDAMAGLATEMHAKADRIAASGAAVTTGRARVLHEYAARIRQALGPEAS
jgi:hypothetical protein